MKVRLLLSCGTGIATSNLAASRITVLLKARGIDAEAQECKAVEVVARCRNDPPDAVVTTTPVPDVPGVKVFGGVPLLTGIGAEELADEIATYLRGHAR
jgi:PTS system galactitol-specific IIB component